jgi:copper transport protein
MLLDQWLRYGALLALGGGALFLALVGVPPRSFLPIRRGLTLAAGVAALATALAVGLEGGVLVAGPAGLILQPATWVAGARTSLGTSAGVALVGVALVTAGLRLFEAGVGPPLALCGVAGLLASFALTGHAATAAPTLLTVPAVAVHVAGVMFWAGSLWPLRVVLSRDRAPAAALVVKQFAALAVPMVVLLGVAGLFLGAVQLASPLTLVASDYGRVLLLKLAMVAVLLLVAADNRRRLTPALAGRQPWAGPALGRSIEIELALIGGILLATSLLTQAVPPRTGANAMPSAHEHGHGAAMPAGFSVVVGDGTRLALIGVTPAVVGQNRLEVIIIGADGEVLRPQEVKVTVACPDKGIEPIERAALAVAPGHYELSGGEFAVSGRWKVEVAALIGDFEQAKFTTEVSIR